MAEESNWPYLERYLRSIGSPSQVVVTTGTGICALAAGPHEEGVVLCKNCGNIMKYDTFHKHAGACKDEPLSSRKKLKKSVKKETKLYAKSFMLEGLRGRIPGFRGPSVLKVNYHLRKMYAVSPLRHKKLRVLCTHTGCYHVAKFSNHATHVRRAHMDGPGIQAEVATVIDADEVRPADGTDNEEDDEEDEDNDDDDEEEESDDDDG